MFARCVFDVVRCKSPCLKRPKACGASASLPPRLCVVLHLLHPSLSLLSHHLSLLCSRDPPHTHQSPSLFSSPPLPDPRPTHAHSRDIVRDAAIAHCTVGPGNDVIILIVTQVAAAQRCIVRALRAWVYNSVTLRCVPLAECVREYAQFYAHMYSPSSVLYGVAGSEAQLHLLDSSADHARPHTLTHIQAGAHEKMGTPEENGHTRVCACAVCTCTCTCTCNVEIRAYDPRTCAMREPLYLSTSLPLFRAHPRTCTRRNSKLRPEP